MSATFRFGKQLVSQIALTEVCDEIRRQGERHKVKVIVQMDRHDRSDEQNAALHGVAYKVLSEHTGYHKEELHEIFLRMFFGEVQIEMMGRSYTKPRRTTTTNERGERDVISTSLFAEYYSFIQIVAAEKLSCNVPDPDKNWRQRMYE